MKTALLSLAVVAVAGVPGVASASTISVDGSGTTQYKAASSESNKLNLARPVGPFAFTDPGATIVAGAGCTATGLNAATCNAGNAINATLGDQDDSAVVSSFSIGTVTIDGGSGDDDVLAGSEGGAVAIGGTGDDTIILNANGAGTGSGGSGDDRLAGRSNADTLSGGPGNDLLTHSPGRTKFGTLSGEGGADRLVANGASVTLDGGDGNDLLIGGPKILGGTGVDRIVSTGGSTIDAGSGSDVIAAADGTGNPDTIACGSGVDVVWADASDTVSPDCELVFSGPAPALPGAAPAVSAAQALLTHVPDVS